MKKLFCLLVSIVMIFAFTACGGSDSGSWTREGYFENENGDFLSVTYSDLEDYTGWYVGVTLGGESYGNVIQEEDGKLHGDLVPDYEDGELVVTISEEGDDGLLLEVEGGDSYHFTPMDMTEGEVAITVTINTDGLGYVGCAQGDEELGSEEDFVSNSLQENLTEPGPLTMGARADEDWKFVKWTMNGEDYSTDSQITVDITDNTEFVAIFEPEE